LLYWRWPTVFGGPFGPYLNRNDFATWLIMAIPLTIGYILTRIESRRRNGDGGLSIERAIDATAVWLVGSVCLMSAALLVSLSRSGLTGAVVSLACLLWLSRRRLGSRGRASLLAAVTVMIAIAATYANLGALADRVGETIETGIGGRLTIWRETWSMVRDFWIAGTGVGAYERGMLVYQQTKGLFYVNHAHNEYLQLLAEGGVLVCAVAALTAAAGVAQIAGRLRRDSSPIFWVRAGAVSGLIAVAVQGIWDTGLRMPANAVLFAILAAVTLHRRE
jgi:O-antigen ligase